MSQPKILSTPVYLLHAYDSVIICYHGHIPSLIFIYFCFDSTKAGNLFTISGARAGIKELGPKLIGQDPTQIGVLNQFMDYHLKV